MSTQPQPRLIHFARSSEESSSAQGATDRHELFVRLLTGNYPALYGFVLSLVGERNSADDLMQEVSLLLWRKFDSFDASLADREVNFLRWALVSARNLVRNYHRLQRAQAVLLDDELLTQIAATRCAAEELLEIRREALAECLKKLSATDQRLLQACYGPQDRGRSIKDAAGKLGKNADAVYMSLSRIRRRLYECVNKSLGLQG